MNFSNRLADQLNRISIDTTNVVERLKTSISEKLTSKAQLGASFADYTFYQGVHPSVRKLIFTWLQEEGFTVKYINSETILIRWGAESTLQSRVDTALLGLDIGRDTVVFTTSIYPDSEVEDVIANIKSRGYQIGYDKDLREAIVRKR